MKSLPLMAILLTLLWSCQTSSDNQQPAEVLTSESQELLDVMNEVDALIQQTGMSDKALLADALDTNLIFKPFQNPPELRSEGSVLDTELNVRFAQNQMYNTAYKQNVTINHRSYDGQLVGSTWRIKGGDRLSVFMNNELGPKKEDEECKPLAPHFHGNTIDSSRFNTTNLHVHGLHVSPKGQSDNVFVEIEQGCTFQNEIDLPQDHAAGTFWYHGHVHGSTAIQVSSGMAGAIIIEGGLDDVPEIKAMEEKIFVMQQMPYLRIPETDQYDIPFKENVNFGPSAWRNNSKANGWRTTINGQTIPIIEMAPEEVQRWRFIHAGVRETVSLRLFDKDQNDKGLEAIEFSAIAEDGIAYGYLHDSNKMELQPGYRADLLIKAPNKVGDTLYLIDSPTEVLDKIKKDSITERAKVLALVVLKEKSEPVAIDLPSSESLAGLAPYPSLVDVAPTAELENMEFNIDISGPKAKFQIDRQAFNPTNIRQLTLNQVQDWDLTSGLANHPFHIHVNHFQILEKSICKDWDSKNHTCKEWGEPVKFDKPIWKDTYFVKNKEKTRIRTVYKDFTGKFVIHCHILDHEDQGMMQSVQILEEGQEVSQVNFPDITICDDDTQLASIQP